MVFSKGSFFIEVIEEHMGSIILYGNSLITVSRINEHAGLIDIRKEWCFSDIFILELWLFVIFKKKCRELLIDSMADCIQTCKNEYAGLVQKGGIFQLWLFQKL